MNQTTLPDPAAVENLLRQAGHQPGCQCMPCRVIQALQQTGPESRIRGCRFEECDEPTVATDFCLRHTGPGHGEYGEGGSRAEYRCHRPCTWNCGCGCRTCLDAQAERLAIGHQPDCRCTDCGCGGDLHGDCGIKCR